MLIKLPKFGPKNKKIKIKSGLLKNGDLILVTISIAKIFSHN
jgi:hypothetical protein